MSARVDVTRPAPGGHALPARFASTDAYGPRGRKRRTPVLVGVLSSALLVFAIITLQLIANLGYDRTLDDFTDARASTQRTLVGAQEDVAELAGTTDIAGRLVETDTGALVDPASRDALAAAVAEAADTTATTETILGAQLPEAGPKPSVFWDLFATTTELENQADDLRELADDIEDATPAVSDARTALTESGVAVLGSAAGAASAFEAAHISAKNDAVVALRDAAGEASLVTTLDESAVAVLSSLQDAASQVVSSEQVELAEKAGPLQGVRLEIEAFARSLAPGVLLEFDWSPVVNNAGYNGSMGGLTTWWWDEPDRAVIQLSNSVAEQWPAERSRALVAHEVGHAISVKCEDMYDSTTQDSIEKWATAWAISMGFSDDANGVWAYGYPPQSYIDAAYGCR